MCFFLAWSTVHDDVAYDNTAVWLHVAANTNGAADRFGRIVPPLALGLIVIAVGTPLSAWGFGSAEWFGSVSGVIPTTAALLDVHGMRGVRVRDPCRRQPVCATAIECWRGIPLGAGIIPPRGFGRRDADRDSGDPRNRESRSWHGLALLVGIATGALALWGGIVVGGRVFEKRGPELLAFTARY